jgi:PAS domain S-box-containing protein
MSGEAVRTNGPSQKFDWRSLTGHLLECCSRPAALVDSAGMLRACNGALERLLGFSAGELTGKMLSELCPASDGEDGARRSIEHAFTSPSLDFELIVQTRAGRQLLMAVHGQRLGDAAASGLLLQITDSRPLVAGSMHAAAGDHYEVSSRYDDFGVLLRVWSLAGRKHKMDLTGQRCHRALHDSDEPCLGCPAFATRAQKDQGMAVIPRRSAQLRLDVVQTRVSSPTAIAVSVWQVGDGLLSQIIKAKVDVMAERQGLTVRERGVLDLLVLGRSNEEIGTTLGVAPRTVKYHKRRVLQKLGAESKHDLIRLII